MAINELKSIHPTINVCVSSIVDIAIDHYHIVNERWNSMITLNDYSSLLYTSFYIHRIYHQHSS